MIKIVYGPKGSGKTKRLIAMANADVATAKGLSVFITDNKRCMYDVSRAVKFIDVKDYKITGEEALCGFICGVCASSYDQEYVYVDGIARIAGKPVGELSKLFYMLEKVSNENNITIVLTCSCEKEDLPDFVKKHV